MTIHVVVQLAQSKFYIRFIFDYEFHKILGRYLILFKKKFSSH